MLIILVIFGLLLSIHLINHLFVFVYLHIEYGLENIKDPDLYPPVPLKLLLKNFCLEFWYVSSKYCLYPYKFFNLTENLSKNSTAILLIHGYVRNQSDWLWFIQNLAPTGFPIYTVNLAPSLGSIQEITNHSLPSKIQQIKQETDCQQIILIGHSMGGLVASYYSEYLDEADMIKNVITIATPYHGTKLSMAATGANGKQMLPGSKFCTELRAKIASSARHYFQVASRFDNIVFPWQSELLETSSIERQLVLPFTSHLGLLHSSTVLTQIVAWLKIC